MKRHEVRPCSGRLWINNKGFSTCSQHDENSRIFGPTECLSKEVVDPSLKVLPSLPVAVQSVTTLGTATGTGTTYAQADRAGLVAVGTDAHQHLAKHKGQLETPLTSEMLRTPWIRKRRLRQDPPIITAEQLGSDVWHNWTIISDTRNKAVKSTVSDDSSTSSIFAECPSFVRGTGN